MKGLKLHHPIIITGEDGVEAYPKYINNTANITASIATTQDISTTGNVTFSDSSITSDSGINVSNSKWVIEKNENLTRFLLSGSLLVTGSISNSTDLNLPKDLNIEGKLSAKEIKTSNISASIVYQSGSTKFGDSIDDIHPFTGSVSLGGNKIDLYISGSTKETITEIRNDDQPTSPYSTQPVTEYAAVNILAPFSANQRYNRKVYAKVASSITEDVGGVSNVTFNAETASAPRSVDATLFSQLPATSKEDFIFFRNGMVMEPDALTIQQEGSNFNVSVNTNSIGYSLKENDEIVAWGKFNS